RPITCRGNIPKWSNEPPKNNRSIISMSQTMATTANRGRNSRPVSVPMYLSVSSCAFVMVAIRMTYTRGRNPIYSLQPKAPANQPANKVGRWIRFAVVSPTRHFDHFYAWSSREFRTFDDQLSCFISGLWQSVMNDQLLV